MKIFCSNEILMGAPVVHPESIRSAAHAGPPSIRSRILELDGLRAIAILLVLGCHYPAFAGLFYKIPEFGWIGVDIFFALSGYLITTILLGLRNREKPYKTFYSRRAVRILPPYLAVTLVLVVVAICQHWQVVNFLASQLFFLQAAPANTREFGLFLVLHPKFRLMHLAALFALAHRLPLGPIGIGMNWASPPATYWSLSIEEYFYLLWAPVVLRFSRRTILLVAIVVCLFEMLMRWLGPEYAYLSLFSRFDALLFGGLLAMLLERWGRSGIPAWSGRFFAAVGGFSALSLAAILYAIRPVIGREIRASVLFVVFGLSIFSIGIAALMGLLLLRSGSNWWLARLLRTRVLVFIGTISYTMYLVHVIVIVSLHDLDSALRIGWSPLTEAILATILTILISYLSWHWLEKPLLRWKDQRFPGSPHPSEPTVN